MRLSEEVSGRVEGAIFLGEKRTRAVVLFGSRDLAKVRWFFLGGLWDLWVEPLKVWLAASTREQTEKRNSATRPGGGREGPSGTDADERRGGPEGGREGRGADPGPRTDDRKGPTEQQGPKPARATGGKDRPSQNLGGGMGGGDRRGDGHRLWARQRRPVRLAGIGRNLQQWLQRSAGSAAVAATII